MSTTRSDLRLTVADVLARAYDGQPLADLRDEHAALHLDAAGQVLAALDAPADACQFHSPTGSPCGCGHDGGADCHPNARRTT